TGLGRGSASSCNCVPLGFGPSHSRDPGHPEGTSAQSKNLSSARILTTSLAWHYIPRYANAIVTAERVAGIGWALTRPPVTPGDRANAKSNPAVVETALPELSAGPWAQW